MGRVRSRTDGPSRAGEAHEGHPGASPSVEGAPGPELTVSIDRLGADGEGVAAHAGRALFVPGAVPGERVVVTLEERGKVRRGRLLAVLDAAPERVAPACPLAGTCGGCDWLHLAPEAQRRAREAAALAALERLGGLDVSALRLLPTLHRGDLGTRRRATLHWDGHRLGFLARRSHDSVPVERCPAVVDPLSELPGRLAPLLAPLGRGLRTVELLAEGGAVAAALEVDGRVRPRTREVAEALVRSGLRGVVLVPGDGAAEDVGRPTLESPAPLHPDVTLRLRPEAFAQAHGAATPLLVGAALDALAPGPGEAALELYAGNGTFTFAVAARAASVLAVEGAEVSSRLAADAAARARVRNVRFVQGDVDRVCAGLVQEGRRFDVLLADPPRTGAPGLARAASALGVRRVVDVACDAGALGRDAGLLARAGFRPTTLQLVDMFPGTHHVEAVLAAERG